MSIHGVCTIENSIEVSNRKNVKRHHINTSNQHIYFDAPKRKNVLKTNRIRQYISNKLSRFYHYT